MFFSRRKQHTVALSQPPPLPAPADTTDFSSAIPLTEEERQILEKESAAGDSHIAGPVKAQEDPTAMNRIIALHEDELSKDTRPETGFAII
jgi:hypothetical protein